MAFREYTHCVQPQDYVDNTPPDGVGATIAMLLTDPFALAQWANSACPYMLGGKLVCLGDGSDQCAIGRITKIEPPGDKSFPSNIDNDFSLNILLAPHSINEMTSASYLNNYDLVANDGLQGFLLQEQPGMPLPHQTGNPDDPNEPGPIPSPRYQGEFTLYPDSNYPSYDPSHSPFQVAGSDGHPFCVPCLHVECEGSRVNDVCNAISAVQGPLSAVCDIPIIGWVACFIVDLVTLPILATAVAVAWANATDGDVNDVLVGGGTVNLGDLIVVTGRWVYDAGHQGWNEFHPAKTMQLIPEASANFGSDFNTWKETWCKAIAVVPPFAPPGVRPTDMTPAQASTYANQLDPSNQWVFHPSVDGCDTPPAPPR